MAEVKANSEDNSDEDQDLEKAQITMASSDEKSSQKSPPKNASAYPFLAETKYVMLNFWGLIPQELYQNHVSSSPESAISDLSVGDSYNKHFQPLGSLHKTHHQLAKSRSFDIPRQQRVPKLKHLSQLSAFQDVESPASDDNVNYRYRHYLNSLDQQSIPSNSPCSQGAVNTPEMSVHCQIDSKSQSITSLKSESPGSVSPRKTPGSLSRWYSDVSSSGDFSYASDADDEEDLSNASSVFSVRSACLRGDGFLDLRRPCPRLAPVLSQSEAEMDEVDGLFHPMPPLAEEKAKHTDIDDSDVRNDTQNTEVISETNNDTSNTQTQSPEQGSLFLKQYSKDSGRSHAYFHSRINDQHAHHHQNDQPVAGSSSGLDEVDNGSVCSNRKAPDRSKLKLEIPSQVVQIDDIMLSLRTDLNNEITDLESEFEEALRSSSNVSGRRRPSMPTPLTPQTEAARILARIGDEVRDQYGNQITAAINQVMLHQLKELTYKEFKEIAKTVIDENLPGWQQVALLMVFGQKMVWKALEKGQKRFDSLVDFCAQLVADVAADFIIREGGWGAVMNFDPSQSSDSQSSSVEDTSPGIIDYFSSHNVTQVESGDMKSETSDLLGGSSGTNVDTGQKSNRNNVEQVDGCGEPFDKGKSELIFNDSNVHVGHANSNITAVDECVDSVFDENLNQNAQNEAQISDPNRLNVSGRDLHPSLGFEYTNGLQTGTDDILSAGFEYSQTDYVKDVFNYDPSETEENITVEKTENQKSEKQIKNNSHISEICNTVSVGRAGSDGNKEKNNKNPGGNNNNTEEHEKTCISVGQPNSSGVSNNAQIDNHDTPDNQTISDKMRNSEGIHVDEIHKNVRAKDSLSVKDDQTDLKDSDVSVERVRREDNHWYDDSRRLGLGALGVSVGILAFAVIMRQIR